MARPPVKGGDGKDSPKLDGALIPFLERFGGKRAKQALTVLAAAQLVAPVVQWAWERRSKDEDYTITVAGIDDIYPDLHEWILKRMPQEDRKALIASTSDEDGNLHESCKADSDSEDEEDKPRVRLRYDGSRKHVVTIGGHPVEVCVLKEEMPGRQNLTENWRLFTEKITFTARTAAGRDAVVDMINELLAEKYRDDEPPALFMPSRWGGGWSRRGDLPPRTLDSVVLKEGQLENLVADLGKFLESEDEYVKFSQPWHRGYLFHGEPGTGKTSVARALANRFDLPTYYLPLGDIEKDKDLTNFVSEIQPKSILLIEDVDVYHAATDREEDKDKVSVAAMLNALDGIWTPHGLITVMTTNDKDELDPALIRAGRVDVDEEFTVLDSYQARRLAEYLGMEVENPDTFVGKSPSEMIENLRRRRT